MYVSPPATTLPELAERIKYELVAVTLDLHNNALSNVNTNMIYAGPFCKM